MENRIASKWTCPECRGPLEEANDRSKRLWRCRVGHVYTPSALIEAHIETVERVLWEASVALEEHAEMLAMLQAQFPGRSERSASKGALCREGKKTLQGLISSLARGR
jgi:two-component system, chemotaxis family, protein-glutamate methylesterase/glutaminase